MTRKAEPLTLNNIRQNLAAKQEPKAVRLSDLLTEDERREYKAKREQNRAKKQPYDTTDAFVAEVIGRFGYEVYQKWNNWEIPLEKLSKWLLVERAREKRQVINHEALILSAVAGANHGGKHGKAPKSLKLAQKILKEEQKIAEGRG